MAFKRAVHERLLKHSCKNMKNAHRTIYVTVEKKCQTFCFQALQNKIIVELLWSL